VSVGDAATREPRLSRARVVDADVVGNGDMVRSICKRRIKSRAGIATLLMIRILLGRITVADAIQISNLFHEVDPR